MQFQYNSDYPGLSFMGQPAANAGMSPELISRPPPDFPPAQPIPCARITTRVFHPTRNQVATVQNVLVRTMNAVPPGSTANVVTMAGGGPTTAGNATAGADDEKFDPFGDMSSSSSSDSDDDSMGMGGGDDGSPSEGGPDEIKQAYWIQRTIREAIYGRVLFAVILKRRPRALYSVDGAEWEVTNQHCAVKEMSWQHIRKEKDRLAEDPIKEVSAMQYIQKWYQQQKMLAQQQVTTPNNDADVMESFAAMRATNIMMPLDLLSDERNLYSIMPYCDGGELFERLDMNERFSEEEARYWMDQVLNVRNGMRQMNGWCK